MRGTQSIVDIVRSNCGIVDMDTPETITEKIRFSVDELGLDVEEVAPYLLVERIVKRFAPERVILFGSYATRKTGFDSDIDLRVVMPLKRTKAALEGRVLYAKR